MARPIKHPLRTDPLILCIENSTMYGSVALVSGSGCISEHTLISSITHSKRLLTEIDQVMQECELEWHDLDALAVSLGPGSFTGLRIGLTTVKGICMATELPLIGLTSLEALACQIPHGQTPICPILDARKQEVYTALYQTKSGLPTTIIEPMVLPIKSLLATLDTETIFIGDGVELHRDEIRQHLGEQALFAPPQLVFPRASAIGTLALRQFQAKDYLDPASASPLYIRPSDAEVNLKKAQLKA